jgi:uncharacterized protein (DUF433 family)
MIGRTNLQCIKCETFRLVGEACGVIYGACGNFSVPASADQQKHVVRARLRDNEGVAQAISRDPDTMHGVPVFTGTRVPVQTLFEYLEGGETLEDFLEGFPTVPRDLAIGALEEAKHLLLARAS